MRCLVVYDIPDDRIRTRVADCCLDYGLVRVQYSAFWGRLSGTHRSELMLRIKRLLGRKAGRVHLFVICDKDWQQRLEVVQGEPGEGG